MGIVNVTPDSFSDGGKYATNQAAIDSAMSMVRAGVHWLDIGGESTRPGAKAVSAEEELERVIPVIEGIRRLTDTPISIDTSKPQVMREAVSAGANMINDVYALTKENAVEAAVQCNVPVCLMHMQGTPATMQNQPQYANVVEEVFTFLTDRAQVCLNAGIEKSDIVFDPGFGFGKTVEHNYVLLRNLARFRTSGHKVLAGMSRKSMIGAITNKNVENRLAGSLAAATIAMHTGADFIRVHDVEASLDALRIYKAFIDAEINELE